MKSLKKKRRIQVLVAAAVALLMATVLIGDGHGKPLGDHIDHIAPYLLDFLTDLTFTEAAA